MPSWTASDIPDQSGRTALVTGASSGLGLATSTELARHGARVLMAVRDQRKGEAALKRILAEVPGAAVELVTLDLTSLASVAATAEEVATRLRSLDVLVDNAGVMAVPRGRTADGFETQLGTNHLGHFALTGRLLPLLLAAPAPRVVVVSSDAHKIGRMRFDDLMGERSYGRWSAYGQSKLANLLFVRELDRRVREKALPLVAAAAHPGYAATNLQSGQGNRLLEAGMRLGNLLVAQSEEHGAWPQEYAATMPDVTGGAYYGPGGLGGTRGSPTLVQPSARARDDVAAHRLWDASVELTGVRYDALS
jgi:NAD(P)-dependent dehydrogenase (short-subunit alcohol dehydrogenase family)